MKKKGKSVKRASELRRGRRVVLQRLVGHTYVFMREGHDWHGCDVTLISKDPTGCVVTLATATWKALQMQAASKMGRPFALVVTPCTEGELW